MVGGNASQLVVVKIDRDGNFEWRNEVTHSPVLSTCLLHTYSGCGKERRIVIGLW